MHVFSKIMELTLLTVLFLHDQRWQYITQDGMAYNQSSNSATNSLFNINFCETIYHNDILKQHLSVMNLSDGTA